MPLLRRKIDEFLSEWKSNPDRMPLIVKGARQIGKTASIQQFAENNYKHIISVNFIEDNLFLTKHCFSLMICRPVSTVPPA